MITDRILSALIVFTTMIFAGMGFVVHLYALAVYALTFGLIWFILTLRKIWSLSAVLFLLFLALAIWGCLQGLPIPAILLGICTTLSAWDLSRFRARIAVEEAVSVRALEARHLRILLATVSAGFAVAVLPLFVKLSISFVGIAFIALVAMLVFRQSVRSAQRR